MIHLSDVESIATVITLIFAYAVSCTLSGAAQAWVALKNGDDSAAEEGYLSLNPIAHINGIGILSVIFFRLGWGNPIPVNAAHIYHNRRLARLAAIFGSEVIVYVTLALFSIFFAVFFFGSYPIACTLRMLVDHTIPLRALSAQYTNHSSLAIVGAMMLVAFAFFNVFAASLSVILNGVRYILLVGAEKGHDYMEHADIIALIVPLILLMFFAHEIQIMIMQLIVPLAATIARLLGAAA